jgi:hypothetical protein
MRVANIPAETAYLRSTTGSAVSEDWVVETEGTELPTPHAVIEPVSDTRVRNGNFDAETGAQNQTRSARLLVGSPPLTLSANALYLGQIVTWAAAKLPH